MQIERTPNGYWNCYTLHPLVGWIQHLYIGYSKSYAIKLFRREIRQAVKYEKERLLK